MEDACLLAAWLALMAALVAVGPPYVALLAPVHNERDEWQAQRPEDRFEVVVGEHLMTADGASARKRRKTHVPGNASQQPSTSRAVMPSTTCDRVVMTIANLLERDAARAQLARASPRTDSSR